jgi:hypothetical protein
LLVITIHGPIREETSRATHGQVEDDEELKYEGPSRIWYILGWVWKNQIIEAYLFFIFRARVVGIWRKGSSDSYACAL